MTQPQSTQRRQKARRVLLLLAVLLGGSFGHQLSATGYAQERPHVLTLAQQQLGVPYVWGGETPATGFDCSGLMRYVFAQAGIALPRTAAEQARTPGGVPVPLTHLQPGDLVFFVFDPAKGIDHVALYAGNGWMIHAPAPGSAVRWDVLWQAGWWERAVGGLRVTAPAPAPYLPVMGPPSLSRDAYIGVVCTPRNGQVPPPCAEAGAMYDLLVASSLDPAVQLAFALKETELGTTGPGRSPQRNLHNLECNGWDGGSCTGPYHLRFGAYPSYLHATWAWATLLLTRGRYVDAGNWTVEQVVPIYAPAFENDTAGYIAFVRSVVLGVRGQSAGMSGMSGMSGIGEPHADAALDEQPRPSSTPTPVPDPIPDPPSPIPVRPCGKAIITDPTPRLTDPGAYDTSLGTLPPGATVTRFCRDGQPVQAMGADGTTWQRVDSGDATYPWVAAGVLE